MNLKSTLTILLCLPILIATAQTAFHTLNMPSASPHVIEKQTLGITQIEVDYSSPALRNRDVWKNPNVIPQKGNPYPWRVGANMNTTISFNTEVTIEGQALNAGKYGFHIIPEDEDNFTLLFAHANDLWGSYYLDIEKDVTLKVPVKATECPKSEQLDFEFLNRNNDSLDIALEWGTKKIAFTVSVDLNTTVVDNFRKELRGINTYRWEAWNDAANWCLQNKTNLEEALTWAERSVIGGYGGFAANKNLTNLTTKLRIENELDLKEAAQKTIENLYTVDAPAYDYNGTTIYLLRNKLYEEASKLSEKAMAKHGSEWYIKLNHAICHYFIGKQDQALALLEETLPLTPDGFKERLKVISKEIKEGTYKLP